eukprot:EG_transcript_26055
MSLHTRWHDCCREAGLSDPAETDRWWRWLAEQYGEPRRHYHTLAHVAEMFARLDATAPPLAPEDSRVVALAVFFHDAVYDPAAKDNEEQSAAQFCCFATATAMPSPVVDRVAAFILQTKDHWGCASEDPALRRFLDADLAILGAPQPRYAEYARQVRQEYGHLSPEDFRSGRSAFLRHALQRPHLFLTTEFREVCEDRARENVMWELQELTDTDALTHTT